VEDFPVLSAVLTQRLFAVVALLSAYSQAPAPVGEAKKVKVTVVVILANDYWDLVDPQLKHIAEEIRKSYPSFRGFTLASMDCKSLDVDEKTTFPLVENATVQVIIHKAADKTNKVDLAITCPWQKEILYRSICGKFLPIVTRYDTREFCPPPAVLNALALAQGGQATSPLAVATLLTQCHKSERLILAIRVQPCNGK